jgi:sulfate/thiosulfate transport system permease protein
MMESQQSFVKRGRWTRRMLIGAVAAYIALLLLAPLGELVRGAFAEGPGALAREVTRPEVLSAFRLTLLLAAGSVAINAVFGLTVAWVLVKHRFPGRRLLNALVDLPFAVSPVVAGYMLILLFGRQGWFSGFPFQVVFSWPGMLLATAFVSLPFVVREVMPLLQEFGRDQEEAAATLGADSWRTFWLVTLPSIRWGLLYGVALTLARSVGEFGAVLVVSGAMRGYTETATLFVFRAMDERLYVATYGVSLLLAAASFLFLAWVEAVQKRARKRLAAAEGVDLHIPEPRVLPAAEMRS